MFSFEVLHLRLQKTFMHRFLQKYWCLPNGGAYIHFVKYAKKTLYLLA